MGPADPPAAVTVAFGEERRAAAAASTGTPEEARTQFRPVAAVVQWQAAPAAERVRAGSLHFRALQGAKA